MTHFVTVLSLSYHCLILEDSHTARPRPSIPHKYLITPYFGSPHMRPYTRASARRIQRLRAPDHVAESCTAQAVGAAEAPDLALQCCSDFALMATPAAPQPCLRKARCTDRQSVSLQSHFLAVMVCLQLQVFACHCHAAEASKCRSHAHATQVHVVLPASCELI